MRGRERYARPRTGRGDIAQARLTQPPSQRGQGLCPCPASPPFASPRPCGGLSPRPTRKPAYGGTRKLASDPSMTRKCSAIFSNVPLSKQGNCFTRSHGEHGVEPPSVRSRTLREPFRASTRGLYAFVSRVGGLSCLSSRDVAVRRDASRRTRRGEASSLRAAQRIEGCGATRLASDGFRGRA